MGDNDIYTLQLLGKLNDNIIKLDSIVSPISNNPILPQTGVAYTLASKFGIGTNNPVAQFDVLGKSIFTGEVQINGDITVSGITTLDIINGITMNITNDINSGSIVTNNIIVDTLKSKSVLLADSNKNIISTNNLLNGQLIIGSTNNVPQVANLTSVGGTITITNGPGTINLEAVGGGGGNVFNNIIITGSGNAPSGISFTGATPYLTSVNGLVLETNSGLTISQNTVGNPVQILKTVTTNDSPIEMVYQNRITTIDATPTTLHTFTIPASTTYAIETMIIARRTGGTSGTAEDGGRIKMEAVYNNIGGVATIIGSVTKLVSLNNLVWNVDYLTSGNTVTIVVYGAVNNNITWHHTSRVYYLSS